MAGFDTTVNLIASGTLALLAHPGEMARLRQDPSLLPAAVEPQFPDPNCLDLGRDTSGHVAFGHGIHYCLGAPLARMEAEVALGALLACFPGLSLAVPPEELRWRPVSLMNGLESLPVRLA
jgi:cytochrome P450